MKQILTILSLLVAISAYNQNIQESSLKILSWNIYMLPQIVPRIGRLNRAESIAEQLNNSDFDIIVFQEAFMKSARDIISATLIDNYPYQYGPGNEKGEHNEIARFYGVYNQITVDYILFRNNGIKTNINRTISIIKSKKRHLSDHYGIASEIFFY